MVTAFRRGLSGPVGAKAVHGRDVYRWAQRIDTERLAERHAIRVCLAVGLAFDGMVLLVGEVVVRLLGPYRSDPPPHGTGLALAGGLCLVMLFAAALTKPDGRAEQASRVIDEGFQSAGRGNEFGSGRARAHAGHPITYSIRSGCH